MMVGQPSQGAVRYALRPATGNGSCGISKLRDAHHSVRTLHCSHFCRARDFGGLVLAVGIRCVINSLPLQPGSAESVGIQQRREWRALTKELPLRQGRLTARHPARTLSRALFLRRSSLRTKAPSCQKRERLTHGDQWDSAPLSRC